MSLHNLFQVSTSGALVTGVNAGAISVQALLLHGDFGLGTFERLDGEMIILDGRVYRARGNGDVSEAEPTALAPFAVITRFTPVVDIRTPRITSLEDLTAFGDHRRSSNNIFFALRLDGHFTQVRTRAVSRSEPGSRLIDAARAQHEFELNDVVGTLVGLWSPGFSSAFSVPGYHFHFLTQDRRHGGHLLQLSADPLRLRIEPLRDFHLALPETESYLKADLSRSVAGELAYSEQAHEENSHD
jgi:acetolactate decarboxylase